MITDLSDLIDNPREDLEVELKQWLDLNDPVVRANLARHMAALCNHGGGYIVFGVKDDLTIDPDRPPSLSKFNRDTFGSIIKKYLSPAFQCDVTIVASTTAGDDFPIVRVPGHGVVPVCAKAGGPHDTRGKPQGIRKGAYYIRGPGPESIEIASPQDWNALIRRCTVNDRNDLLKDVAVILQGREIKEPVAEDRLQSWHNYVETRFHDVLEAKANFTWPLPFQDNFYQLSYVISHEDKAIPIDELRHVLEVVNNEVRDTVWTGWSMFYPFTRPEFAPLIYPENKDGTGSDVLECDLLEEGDYSTATADFWRIAPEGRASIIRGYREDVRLPESGRWLAPETVLRETTELVRHARGLARYFPSASTVSFRCTWKGLRGREFKDFDPSVHWSRGRIANAPARTVPGEYPVVELSTAWPNIVADLGCPVLHLFGFTDCSAQLVKGMARRFIKL